MQFLPLAQNKANHNHLSRIPHKCQDRLVIILFHLPALLLFLTFVIYPIFRSLYFSTFNWKGFGPAVDYVGLENYRKIFSDEVFIKAVKNVLIIIMLSLGIQLPMAMILAVMVGRDLPGRAVFRTIFFLPYVLSEVNTAIMWMLLYNADPDRGFLNSVVRLIG